MSEIAERIEAIRARIAAACERSGRDASDVTLVGVSKTHAVPAILEAWHAGLCDFGENRVQEGTAKIDALRAQGIAPRWHLLGHLQTNKIRAAIGRFDILHSIDSIRLAERINEISTKSVRVLLEVNIGGEASKFGVAPAEAAGAAERLGGLANIDLAGLMTVAPEVDDPEDARPVFRELRALRDAIGLRELSMGMTGDFEVAIEEGATIVRVGRAIFGERTA